MSTLIKNGTIITASDDYLADIFIEGEVVTAIGKHLQVNPDKVIDTAKGQRHGSIKSMPLLLLD